jgi:hypothetical protein
MLIHPVSWTLITCWWKIINERCCLCFMYFELYALSARPKSDQSHSNHPNSLLVVLISVEIVCWLIKCINYIIPDANSKIFWRSQNSAKIEQGCFPDFGKCWGPFVKDCLWVCCFENCILNQKLIKTEGPVATTRSYRRFKAASNCSRRLQGAHWNTNRSGQRRCCYHR